MAFPPEKNERLLDIKDAKSLEPEAYPSSSPRVYQPVPDSRSRAISPSPTFPTEKAPTPPPIHYPESSSSSRAIVSPTIPIPFDNNPPPPSYYSDGFANSASSSHFAPASSITSAAISVPMGGPGSPPSFSRPPSREVTYPNFPPMFLVATGKSLSKGFPFISPASNSNPHPFTSHDIYEVDWMRYFSLTLVKPIAIDWKNLSFLRETQMVAALTPKQVELSERLPILSILPIVSE